MASEQFGILIALVGTQGIAIVILPMLARLAVPVPQPHRRRRGNCPALRPAALVAERLEEVLILFVSFACSILNLGIILQRFQAGLVALTVSHTWIERPPGISPELRWPPAIVKVFLAAGRRAEERP